MKIVFICIFIDGLLPLAQMNILSKQWKYGWKIQKQI